MKRIFYICTLLTLSVCLFLPYSIKALDLEDTGSIDDTTEFSALKALWDSTNGAGWTNTTGWPTAGNWPASATAAEMSGWYGVTVSNGDITKIDLCNNNLDGSIPSAFYGLTGLTRLDISVNSLSGGLSSSLGNLTNLMHLDISSNQFTGLIPASIGNLTSLTYLNLAYITSFTAAPIPDGIQYLTGLTSLSVYKSNRNGVIPSWIGNLSSLISLSLGENSYSTQSFPAALFNLVNLNYLYLNRKPWHG